MGCCINISRLNSCHQLVHIEMAPYMSTLPSSLTPPSADLQSRLKAKNEEQLKKIEAKIKDAEESLGETDVSEPMREKAGYLVTIGDKVRCLPAPGSSSPVSIN